MEADLEAEHADETQLFLSLFQGNNDTRTDISGLKE
jgi:hypothetical protein